MATKPYTANPSQRDTINIDQASSSKTDQKKERARIWNVFKPVVTLDEMSIEQSGTPDSRYKVEDAVSLSYPMIKINEYFFAPDEINSVTINSNGFLPTITLSVTLMNRLFVTKHMPKDGDIISIMIRNKSDVLQPIRNDYVITSAPSRIILQNEKSPVSLTFFGELSVPGLKSFLGTYAMNGTALDVLKTTADQLELGFNTNVDNTNDKQIWISSGTSDEFIKDTTSKIWNNENSFFDCWIDIYYNLNIVDIQKILLSQETEIDPALLVNNVDAEYTWGANVKETDAVETAKVLSNFMGFRTSSNYIMSWKPVNKSSGVTFDYGTSMECSFYEHLDILYADPESRKYWKLEISPDYDPDKVDSHILLRGRTTWDPSINQGEQARANYSYKKIYKRAPWLGIQYTITNPDENPSQWTGNHHANYMRAQVHNLMNTIELDKLNVEVKVQGTNTNIIKGDKLPIALIQGDPFEANLVHPEENPREALDFFYSGWYYVKGFSLTWSNKGDNMTSNFSQTFTLTRREWPTPEPVDPIKTTEPQNKKET